MPVLRLLMLLLLTFVRPLWLQLQGLLPPLALTSPGRSGECISGRRLWRRRRRCSVQLAGALPGRLEVMVRRCVLCLPLLFLLPRPSICCLVAVAIRRSTALAGRRLLAPTPIGLGAV